MYRIATIIFPIVLVGFEVLMRFALKLPVWDFAGPTLCVAGMSMLISLTKIPSHEIQGPDAEVATYIKRSDFDFVFKLFGLILLFIILWAISYYFSQSSNNISVWIFPLHGIVGAFAYTFSCIILSNRER